jgi:LPXTG-motif cell wall-anchored protein
MPSAMEFPHWLMVAGAVLVVIGLIGFAFRRNKDRHAG